MDDLIVRSITDVTPVSARGATDRHEDFVILGRREMSPAGMERAWRPRGSAASGLGACFLDRNWLIRWDPRTKGGKTIAVAARRTSSPARAPQ
jgi:hypothetical protein